MQRIGRAARASGLFGFGILLYEPWAELKSKAKAAVKLRSATDEDLIGLVNETGCLRKFLREVYNNPVVPKGLPHFLLHS